MKLLHILREIQVPPNKVMTTAKWWIDSKGKPYWISGSQEHDTIALALAKKIPKIKKAMDVQIAKYDEPPNKASIKSIAYLELQDNGWVRGGRDNNVVYFAFSTDESRLSKQTRETMLDISMVVASKMDFVEFEFEDAKTGMDYSDSSVMDDVEKTIMRKI